MLIGDGNGLNIIAGSRNSAANATSTSASSVLGSIIFEFIGINVVNSNYNTVGIGSGNGVDIFV